MLSINRDLIQCQEVRLELTDSNSWNLANTVESKTLQPLVDYGYIYSFNKIGDDPKSRKYTQLEDQHLIAMTNHRGMAGSVKSRN